jgi:fructuronate reductase
MSGLPRLSAATLDRLPAGIARPDYARERLVPGIVHFGPGAFHRAHQAAYVDAILGRDPRWGISAVALNSTGVADALDPQDGLYTLTLRDELPRYCIIGSLVERLSARDGRRLAARLAHPHTRLITATVTEKGYCLTPDGGLDMDHPAIRRDLTEPDRPTSYVGWLAHGLAERRASGAGGLTVLSCDNLASNGRRQARALLEYAQAIDPNLARWIEDEVRFPSSMVDSITPATDDRLRDQVAAATGLYDAWPIGREPFTQWVVEDDFAGDRPPLEEVGVQYVRSVEPFELAKLRLLNGAHSSLAYLGILLGHQTVDQAIGDPALGPFVERLMRDEIAATLNPFPGLDRPGYISAVLARFRNPAVQHSLWQIAWDGSQKLPFRLVASMADARAAGRPVDRLALPIAAWFRFLGLPRPPAPALVDPHAARLTELSQGGAADRLIDESGLLPEALRHDPVARAALRAAYASLGTPDRIRQTIAGA